MSPNLSICQKCKYFVGPWDDEGGLWFQCIQRKISTLETLYPDQKDELKQFYTPSGGYTIFRQEKDGSMTCTEFIEDGSIEPSTVPDACPYILEHAVE